MLSSIWLLPFLKLNQNPGHSRLRADALHKEEGLSSDFMSSWPQATDIPLPSSVPHCPEKPSWAPGDTVGWWMSGGAEEAEAGQLFRGQQAMTLVHPAFYPYWKWSLYATSDSHIQISVHWRKSESNQGNIPVARHKTVWLCTGGNADEIMRKCGKFFKFLFLFFSVPGGPHLCSCHVSLGSSWLPKFSDASCFRWPWEFWGTLARYVPDCSLIGFVRYLSHNKTRLWVSWKQTMESHRRSSLSYEGYPSSW